MPKKEMSSYKNLKRSGRMIDDWDSMSLDAAPLTDHARNRVSARAITQEQIQRVIDHGREVHQRHATIYFVGDREIQQDKSLIDCDGIHVICAPNGSTVLTAYRNKTLIEKRYFANKRPRSEIRKARYGK
jgi:hypothetical protein